MYKFYNHKLLVLIVAMICTFSLSAQYNISVTTSDGMTVGPFNAVPASFGSVTGGCDGTEVEGMGANATDVTDGTMEVCNGVVEDLTGLIAFIDRGSCEFGTKCLNAEMAGAVAIVVCNNSVDAPITMAPGALGDQVTVPCFMIGQADCAEVRESLEGSTISLVPDGLQFDPSEIVLWGDEAGEGDFAGGLNEWTTEDYVACSATLAGDEDFSLWSYNPDGVTRGGCGSNTVQSPTVCNGAAVFESDYYDNAGIACGVAIDSLCNAPQLGALISPSIPVSDFGDAAGVTVSFYQVLRHFTNSQYFVGWSTDGGMTWDSTEINNDRSIYPINGTPLGLDQQRVPLPASVLDADSLKIKFTYNATYYYWVIDDVRIIERESNNLRVNSFFAIPPNAITPQSQVEAFGFLADVENIGAVAQDEVNLNVTIFNEDGDIVFTDDLGYGTIASDSLAENEVFNETFKPTEIGLYQGFYTITSNNEDFDEEDNQQSFNFFVSDTTYAKDLGVNLSTLTPADITTWSAGNYFFVPNGDGYKVTSVDFGIGNPADIVGLNVIVTISEWNDDNGDGIAQVDERILIGFKEYEIEDETANFVNLSFTDEEDDEVILKDSTGYLVMIGYNGPIGFVEANGIDYTAFQFLADQNGQPSHRSFFNIETADVSADYNPLANVPFVRMNINTTPVNVEETLTAENEIKLYPNPATTQLTLDLDLQEVSKNVRLRVFDMTGRLVSRTRLENISNQEFTFNTSSLQSGMYIMEITTDFGVRTVQFEVAQ